jgi:hypothetical protein
MDYVFKNIVFLSVNGKNSATQALWKWWGFKWALEFLDMFLKVVQTGYADRLECDTQWKEHNEINSKVFDLHK